MSKDIFLINYNGIPGELYYLVPDNGLSALASFLLSRGYNPLILDYVTTGMVKKLFNENVKLILKEINCINEDAYKIDVLKRMVELKKEFFRLLREEEEKIALEIIELIKKYHPSVIGFKLWESFGFHGSTFIAGEIKKTFPKIMTLAGGPHVDMYDRYIFNFTENFDYLVYGEGEVSLEEILKNVNNREKIKKIPNVIYRDGANIKTNPIEFVKNPSELPDPVYDEEIYPAIKGNDKIKAFLLEASRGCPNKCKFCIHPKKSGEEWRKIGAGRVVDQMEKIINKYDSSMFRLADSSPPPGMVTSIGQEIINRNLKIDFSTFEHVKNYGEENFDIIKRSGCHAVMFGVESGCQYILDNAMGKGISVDNIKKSLKDAKKAGLYTIASVIVPGPYETEESAKKTLKLLAETKPDSATVHCAILTPHTPWWYEKEKYNFKFINRDKTAEKLMTMIYSFLYPPLLWDNFPYRLNGMGHREMLKTTKNMIDSVIKNGIFEGTHDFQATLALGTGQDVKELRDRSEHALWSGNSEVLDNIVSNINQKIKEKAESQKKRD